MRPSEEPTEPRVSFRDRIIKPVFILSSPRSGSTLLFETLSQARGLHTIGGESHRAIESIPSLSPRSREWSSNRLTAAEATSAVAEQLARNFYEELHDRDGRPPDGSARMLEKTPKNALRVPFFDAVWPDSLFVYLYRDVRQTLASMIEAWRSGRFRTYPKLPGWTAEPWSLLLVPGWSKLQELSLPEIVAHQWAIATNILLDDLEQLASERVRGIDYDRFLADPHEQAASLARSLDLQWDRQLPATLPCSRMTVSQPREGKWRAIGDIIGSVWPIVEQTDIRARAFRDRLQQE